MSQNTDASSAAAMWKEPNIIKQSKHVILRYLANNFGTCIVIPETQIEKFRQKHIEPECNVFETLNRKK